jgi:hypothetical protein
VQATRGDLEAGRRADFRVPAESEHVVSELGDETAAVLVVLVDDGARWAGDLREEDLLGREVVLEVLVKVEVVAREVRENGRGEPHTVGPLQSQRVRGDLHDGVLDAGIGHLGKPLLQDDGVGRGAVGHEALVAGAVFDRADQPRRLAAGVEDRFNHARGRRLPRGAGDANER